MSPRPTIARLAAFTAAALAVPVITATSGHASADQGRGDGVRSNVLFSFQDDQIKESSGIAVSALHRRVVFTHNDSGDDARFFAIGPSGGTRAVFTLDGAGSWDWEDMSPGPRDTLWFGDIGANQLGRDYVSAFRVKEPRTIASRNVAWTRFTFVYDDGRSHNAEAFLVNPRTGRVFVVTKAESGAGVYRAPKKLSTTQHNVLHRIAAAPTKITGGAFSPDGKRIVLRNWGTAFFYREFGGPAREVRLPSGGESIGFARYRPGIVVGSEGLHSSVWHVVP